MSSTPPAAASISLGYSFDKFATIYKCGSTLISSDTANLNPEAD
jgi:hypothetical protein